MLAKILSSVVIGIDGYVVEVEVDITRGLPSFTIVGLPEASVKESKERVKAAINNSGYNFPDDRITVNLAPANIKKEGTGFDLPIALGILSAIGTVPKDSLADRMFYGELSLDGRIKPIKGSLPMVLAAKNIGLSGIVVPFGNRHEASVVAEIDTIPVYTLSDLVEILRGSSTITPFKADIGKLFDRNGGPDVDFNEVVGQEHVKRAMEIAAAGGHNLLMIGPPGAGKTMLAKRLVTVLPPLTFSEAIETTKIFSVVGLLGPDQTLITHRPFRSPHHTISDAGLIGGGHKPKPGEVSLAHNGVLFLDELPEFKKHVLEAMRQPLEDRKVTISRATQTITYPSRIMLIAAMNPCPCGYLTDSKNQCRCTYQQVHRYRSKISGPLLDRIDIHVDVPAVPYNDLVSKSNGENSADIRNRVHAARSLQVDRYQSAQIFSNAQMNSRQLKRFCSLDTGSRHLLETVIDKFGLSARAYNRILKIARTIADLADQESITMEHVSEAVQFRSLDRHRKPVY